MTLHSASSFTAQRSAFAVSRRRIDMLAVLALIFLWSDGFALQMFSISDNFSVLKLLCMFTLFGLTILLIVAGHRHRALRSTYGVGILMIIGCAVITTFVYLVIFNNLPVTEALRVNLFYPGLFSFFVLAMLMNYPGAADQAVRVIVITMAAYITFLLFISVDRQLGSGLISTGPYPD